MPPWTIDRVRLAVARDPGAVRELVDDLAPVIQARVARILLRCPSGSPGRDLRDLVQEVFVLLFADDGRVLKSWDPNRGLSLANFVGLVAERRTFSLLRADPPGALPLGDPEEGVGEPADRQSRIDELVADREIVLKLLAAVRSRLGERSRILFQWLLVEDRGIEEVCGLTDLSPEAAYAWRSRLRKLARQLLEEMTR